MTIHRYKVTSIIAPTWVAGKSQFEVSVDEYELLTVNDTPAEALHPSDMESFFLVSWNDGVTGSWNEMFPSEQGALEFVARLLAAIIRDKMVTDVRIKYD